MEDKIFHFNDRPALAIQCDTTCSQLYNHFHDVLEQDSSALFGDSFPVLQALVQQVKTLAKEKYEITFFSNYGCALLVGKLDVLSRSVSLVGPDGWQNKIHASYEKGREETAVPDLANPAILEVGSIPSHLVETIVAGLRKKILQAEKIHKTPSFVWARLLDAMLELELLSADEFKKHTNSYQGGTTDVGLHTGCLPRNTPFPLVSSLYCAMLTLDGDCEHCGFFKALSVYFLHHLRNITSQTSKYDRRKIDRGITVIRELRAIFNHVKGAKFKAFVIKEIKSHHHKLTALKPEIDPAKSKIPCITSVEEECTSAVPPCFPDVPMLSTNSASGDIARAQAEAKRNLNWSDLESYVPSGATAQDAWVALARINRFFWSCAMDLTNLNIRRTVKSLKRLLETHCLATAKALKVSRNDVHVFSVELKSHEMLVTWIACCWAHRIATEKHPLYRGYSAALDPKDLKCLVLQDAGAIEAARHVQRFLHQQRASAKFPFRNHIHTLELALAVGRSSTDMKNKYDIEISNATNRIDERYRKIEETQAKLRVLDQELVSAKRRLAVAQANEDISKDCDFEWSKYGSKIFSSVYRAYERTRITAQAVVSDLSNKISRLEQPPADVFLPLPRNQETALQWLFFLYMPAEFIDVLSLAHLGESKLWSNVPTAASASHDLLHWFRCYKTSVEAPVALGKMTLGTNSRKEVSPLARGVNIRRYAKDTGIFFPDSYALMPLWTGTDPFSSQRNEEDTARLFTESLPSGVESRMQEFLVMLPSPSRGNIGIATKNRKPEWLTHEEYLMFVELRAFPHLQMRQLLRAMVENMLPFEKDSVHVLVQQLVYHIGVESWKKDLIAEQGQQGLDRLAEQLDHKAEVLQESPNNTGKLLLFGVVSSFFAQYSTACLCCSRDYVRIARSLAGLVDSEVREKETVSPDLYWKQAKLYGCAILSSSTGDDSDEYLLQMIDSMVLFRNKANYATAATQSKELDHAIQCHMSKRIPDILKAANANLTHLTKCLGKVVEGVSLDLTWTAIEYGSTTNTACFEAHGDHHYSINLLNGIILVDGVPPGFLPSSILKDPLYQRTFGTRNFECIIVGVNHFRTAKFCDGHYQYEFVNFDGQLRIIELKFRTKRPVANERAKKNLPWFGRQQEDALPSSAAENATLELAESLLLLSRDTLEVPTLLTEPYSHWYSLNLKAIFVRYPHYKSRSVMYAMTQEGTYSLKSDDSLLPIIDIVGNLRLYDRLILSPPQVTGTLSRLEKLEYILAWANPDNTRIHYTLPRLGLEFDQTAERIDALNFSGFYLRQGQTLEGTLPGVASYLIVVDNHGSEKVLIPSGDVDDAGNVVLPTDWKLKSSCFVYDVHRRFGNLVAKDDLGRLQLACMYAATACYAVEQRSKKTGMMMATELVRHCWTNDQLSDSVKAKLVEVSKRSKLSCTLSLMCSWIGKCSRRMSFLNEEDTGELSLLLKIDPQAVREYRNDKLAKYQYVANLLPTEERLLLGSKQTSMKVGEVTPPLLNETQTFVRAIETTIEEKLLISRTDSSASLVFPLESPDNASGLERTLHDDLVASWDEYCVLQRKQDIAVRNQEACNELLLEVKSRRMATELGLLRSLNKNDLEGFSLAVLTGGIRPASTRDLLRLGLDISVLQEINPFLSNDSSIESRIQAVEWMMLSVLEDKLRRIVDSTTTYDILVEATTIRHWDPWEHVRWLAFEVEQQLQIRPYQYSIVRQLLNNPHSMIQLNMGLGKTSVLVPMLILELTQLNAKVPRINMLPSIINVVKEIYKHMLTASVQHVKIRTLPFQRDFPLESIHEQVISEEMLWCRDEDSCFLVTPQHRNSLLLKQHDQGTLIKGLDAEFVDVIDESDAILHHSFQLVYALGDQEQLPDGHTRWSMIEAFLQIFAESKCPAISELRCNQEAMHCEACDPGAFPRLRLLAGFNKKDQERVSKALCRELIMQPPHQFLWMKLVTGRNIDLLVKIMADSQRPVLESIQADRLFRDHQSDILAARGCIACGLLYHCLRARHRVHYGIDSLRKKMAVPFSASDTPKPRADYSHPDVPILYTCLSYFHDGITKGQLKEALTCLQTLGPTEQETIYSSWIDSVRDGPISAEDLAKFDGIHKVDTDNSVQLELVHHSLCRCMKTVSFWMNNFVFPVETHVFPQRRVTSAWNLVDKHNALGFSGTDDNRSLLPLFVKQIKQDVAKLRATNGEMINRIMKSTRRIVLLDEDFGGLWETVLMKCAEFSTHALIDVGGLMAGISNANVALYLVKLFDRDEYKFRGVVYFDTACQVWNVFEFKSKVHHPLQTSSVRAAECFAYYDESRCRGSDLKLRTLACAMVTLEPGLTKDRFLQGCARMRKLRPDAQTLILAGTSETLAPTSTVKDVLEMTIRNTVSMVRKGVVELFERGLNHSKFPAPMDMDVSLETLYSGTVVNHDSIESFLDATMEVEEGSSEKESELVSYCKDIGGGITIQASQLAEECERELENEQEEEEEVEMEMDVAEPYSEQNWAFQTAFSGAPLGIELFYVKDVVAALLGPPLSNIQWSSLLKCTANWRNTIKSINKQGRSYIRPVNSFLAYGDGIMVLITDYEADQLLPYWWKAHKSPVKLGHLAFTNSKIWFGRDEVQLPVVLQASAKLFRGYVSYTEAEKIALEKLFVKVHPRNSILELLQLRHRQRFLERSDLDVFSLLADSSH